MKTGSLFSGYDGLGLAVDELFPDNTREWFCEWDDAPSKILSHHWPTVPNFRDVTEVDWAAIPPVDILTGGYPCQPFSAAGQRKGTDDERHLWPYVREAIRHLRPRFTLLENVAGHQSLGFDRVLGDLAEDGMHVRWTSIRASDIGAPHHRERIFILVTDPSDTARYRERTRTEPDKGSESATNTQSGTRSIGNRNDVRAWGSAGQLRAAAGGGGVADSASVRPEGVYDGSVCDATREGRVWLADGGSGSSFPADAEERGLQGQQRCHRSEEEVAVDHSGVALLPNSENNRRERTGKARDGWAGSADGDRGVEWGSYAPAIRRWERLTRPAPSPTLPNSNGRPQLNAAFAEWMMGVPAGHVTSVPISRAHQLKAIGNGVCPPQAVAAYSSLLAQAVAA